LQILTESSCIVYLGEQIDPAISKRVCRAADLIREQLGPALLECVPSYTSVHISLDFSLLSSLQCCEILPDLLADLDNEEGLEVATRLIEIPAYYGPKVAPDLRQVAQTLALSEAQVVALHTARTCRVYAIGFAPGFCFLGRLDPKLVLPRKASPRLKVPAGSIAIAEQQTAVYPVDTPGGWHLIGRSLEQPLQVGDEVRFVAVDKRAFLAASGQLP
jgi:KipI family sensor histidine kinase inhibitor